jgi:hypothetical protein
LQRLPSSRSARRNFTTIASQIAVSSCAQLMRAQSIPAASISLVST